MPERFVTVYRFVQIWREPEQKTAPGAPIDTATVLDEPTRPPERAGYEIECSAGTYVRSLIADLNDGYCVELRRTAIGPFEVADAIVPPRRREPWPQPPLIGLDQALAALPK